MHDKIQTKFQLINTNIIFFKEGGKRKLISTRLYTNKILSKIEHKKLDNFTRQF